MPLKQLYNLSNISPPNTNLPERQLTITTRLIFIISIPASTIMFFTKIACSLATLATAVTAADFYLQTTGSANPSFNNLYIESYHTGAGLSDAVLSTDVSTAVKFYQNDTNIQADFGNGVTFGIYLDSAINYAGRSHSRIPRLFPIHQNVNPDS